MKELRAHIDVPMKASMKKLVEKYADDAGLSSAAWIRQGLSALIRGQNHPAMIETARERKANG